MASAVSDFRSLGNALYPELRGDVQRFGVDFRSLGNALYPELEVHAQEIVKILDHWEMRSIRNIGTMVSMSC